LTETKSARAAREPSPLAGKTQANIFSADETADVGMREATPVTESYKERYTRSTGKTYMVMVEVK